jgi:hypothetical protein
LCRTLALAELAGLPMMMVVLVLELVPELVPVLEWALAALVPEPEPEPAPVLLLSPEVALDLLSALVPGPVLARYLVAVLAMCQGCCRCRNRPATGWPIQSCSRHNMTWPHMRPHDETYTKSSLWSEPDCRRDPHHACTTSQLCKLLKINLALTIRQSWPLFCCLRAERYGSARTCPF